MSKMKPELFQYRTIWGIDFLAIIKNGYVIDIACSDKDSSKGWRELFSEKTRIGQYTQKSFGIC